MTQNRVKSAIYIALWGSWLGLFLACAPSKTTVTKPDGEPHYAKPAALEADRAGTAYSALMLSQLNYLKSIELALFELRSGSSACRTTTLPRLDTVKNQPTVLTQDLSFKIDSHCRSELGASIQLSGQESFTLHNATVRLEPNGRRHVSFESARLDMNSPFVISSGDSTRSAEIQHQFEIHIEDAASEIYRFTLTSQLSFGRAKMASFGMDLYATLSLTGRIQPKSEIRQETGRYDLKFDLKADTSFTDSTGAMFESAQATLSPSAIDPRLRGCDLPLGNYVASLTSSIWEQPMSLNVQVVGSNLVNARTKQQLPLARCGNISGHAINLLNGLDEIDHARQK